MTLLTQLPKDFTDVIETVLKNLKGSNWISENQVQFLQRLDKINMTTLVSRSFGEYRELETETFRLAIADKAMISRRDRMQSAGSKN